MRDKGKLYLLSFSESEQKLKLVDSEVILNDTPSGEYFIEPVWSPQGEKLLLNKAKDSHYNVENIDVVLYDLKTKALFPLTNTPNLHEKIVSWNSDGSIIIKTETAKSEPLAIQRLILE